MKASLICILCIIVSSDCSIVSRGALEAVDVDDSLHSLVLGTDNSTKQDEQLAANKNEDKQNPKTHRSAAVISDIRQGMSSQEEEVLPVVVLGTNRMRIAQPEGLSSSINEPFLQSQKAPKVAVKQFLYKYAVDINAATTRQTFTCIRNGGYETAFIRAYQPNGNGVVDIHAASNVQNAHNAGLGVEVFVVPQSQGIKRGSVQFDETYNYLKNSGIVVNTVWIQITSPINWPNNQQANVALIQDFMSRAQQYRVSVGISTNWYDWQQITASWSGWSSQQLHLWYWNAYGQGPSAVSANNFEDFRPFAGFVTPAAKQYSQGVNVCGAYVNQNVYSAVASQSRTSSTIGKVSNNKKIIVGTLIGSFN